MTLEQLNAASADAFVESLDGIYALSWVTERAAAQRPFASVSALKYAMTSVIQNAAPDEQLALIRSYPSSAADYQAKFGFPFVLAPQGPRGTGLSTAEVSDILARRLKQPPEFEHQECLREIHRMAEMGLNQLLDSTPSLGNQVWDWCEALAAFSDSPYAERGELTVTYLTDAHRACAAQIAQWMQADCGFDEVNIDAVGNVVGVYHGHDSASDTKTKRLLTGSHYDTVRNGGKYDGRLGFLVPMVCVRELARQGKRLRHGIEVVAFSEEEGQRYKAVFLGSGALTSDFNPDWLEQTDADSISMRQAMTNAGLNPDDIPQLKRDPDQYLGFVEVHIEQGPVLNQLGLPLGVVTSINGSVRLLGEIQGMASHAGTTPMGMRNDAALGVAELMLYLEQRANAEPDLVGTVGQLEVPSGSINVIPGRCRFSLDIRATTDAVRDACLADVKAELQRIWQRRGLQHDLEEIMRVSAAPSDPHLQAQWEQAVTSLGLPVFRLPSGAGHDAMKLHHIMPQAMLFMRGLNAGISHNPLESITNDDTELCVRAFDALLQQLDAESQP